ncbi:MAG: thioredoxin family protein [Bacteroidales bacterium]|nr:thioredoxin family protein [Bacteroidales bacterium]
METIHEYPALEKAINEKELVFIYISQPQCSVCKSLLPKVEELMEDYPRITNYYLDTLEVPIAAGQLSVFSIPTVILFVQGKEHFRLVRTFGLREINDKIAKIYQHFDSDRIT